MDKTRLWDQWGLEVFAAGAGGSPDAGFLSHFDLGSSGLSLSPTNNAWWAELGRNVEGGWAPRFERCCIGRGCKDGKRIDWMYPGSLCSACMELFQVICIRQGPEGVEIINGPECCAGGDACQHPCVAMPGGVCAVMNDPAGQESFCRDCCDAKAAYYYGDGYVPPEGCKVVKAGTSCWLCGSYLLLGLWGSFVACLAECLIGVGPPSEKICKDLTRVTSKRRWTQACYMACNERWP